MRSNIIDGIKKRFDDITLMKKRVYEELNRLFPKTDWEWDTEEIDELKDFEE